MVSLDLGSSRYIKTGSGLSIPLGVISTAPGLLLGGADSQAASTTANLALSGRVPVEVSLANGSIAIGDRLTLSTTTAGTAVKAIHSGQTIGIALDPLGGTASTTGEIEMFVSSQYWLSPNDIAIDGDSGNVGIGTSSPATTTPYKLAVGGDIIATGFVNLSDEMAKTNISHVDASTTASFLDVLRGMMIAEYSYKNELGVASSTGTTTASTTPDRVGFLAQEAPQLVRSSSGNGIDLYKLITVSIGGLQALANKVDQVVASLNTLTTRVVALEQSAQNGIAGAVSGVTGSIADAFDSLLTSRGVAISQDGKLYAPTVATNQLEVDPDSNGNSSVGSATIPAGTTTVEVQNVLVAENSKVFITFNSATGSGWYLANKQDGGFTVALDAPLQSDASFDYMVVKVGTTTSSTTTAGLFNAATTTPAASSGGDSEAPIIIVHGANPAHIAVGSSYVDLGASVTDNVDHNLGIHVSVDGVDSPDGSVNIDTSTPGAHTISYSATDSAENMASASRTVIVDAPIGGGSESGTDAASSTPSGSDSSSGSDSGTASSTPSGG